MSKNGRKVRAGLYLPPDFVPGRRYPIVIQTHGWNPERFWIDGPYSTAFAAQPLANKAFIIIQLEMPPSTSAPKEVEDEMSAYEGAIDYLYDRGLVDRGHVGMIGFSRTGLHVKYTLTHSTYSFAAATVADGSDGGYFAYLASLNSIRGPSIDSEGVNGGSPFGNNIARWLNNSPGFNLERVSTPIRQEANSPASLLYCWEWFAGLLRLGLPVDLIYMPDAAHVLVKPWDRMTSQQGNVDWFCFWLRGEEDPDPVKVEQYKRWRELKKLQETNDAKAKGAAVH